MQWGSFNRWRRGWRAVDEAELSETKQSISNRLDRALHRSRNGLELTSDEVHAAATEFTRLYKALWRRNGAPEDTEFEEDDRVHLYLEALKLAALDHPDHDGWAVRSALRRHVLHGLEARLAKKEDPWVRLCAVTAALASRSGERAVKLHAPLANDPFHSSLANRWANHALMSWPSYNDRPTIEMFLGATLREDAWNGLDAPAAEVRWVLLAAIHPDLSLDPRTTMQVARSPTGLQGTLLASNVVDRASAIHRLEWLLREGRRSQLGRDLVEPDPSRPAQMAFVDAHRDALARHRILAWDLGRLVDVARSARTVGHIAEQELESLLEIVARTLRDNYDSWKELGDDYALGCSYDEPAASSRCPHCANVRWLQSDPRSPWRRVPFGGGAAWR